MSEFKQIEPLPVEIGDELYFDYGNGTAEDGYVHLTSARRAHESTLDYAAAMRLHSTMSRALGLPDVAELQRRVTELEALGVAAAGVIVYLTKNYGGKVHNSTYAAFPELGALIAAEYQEWEKENGDD